MTGIEPNNKRRSRSSLSNKSSLESSSIDEQFVETSTPKEDINKGEPQEDILESIEKQINNDPTAFNASMVDATPKKKDTLTKEQTNKILKLFADKSHSTESLAVLGITALVQGGGTNASMPPITKIINGTKFELKTLRDCVSFVTERKGSVRQLAKTMRTLIYKIALQNGWNGPLATALRKEYPDQQWSQFDLILAAEFHEDNMEEYMPPKVREALVDRAQKLRAAKLQQKPKSNSKKGGKKR